MTNVTGTSVGTLTVATDVLPTPAAASSAIGSAAQQQWCADFGAAIAALVSVPLLPSPAGDLSSAGLIQSADNSVGLVGQVALSDLINMQVQTENTTDDLVQDISQAQTDPASQSQLCQLSLLHGLAVNLPQTPIEQPMLHNAVNFPLTGSNNVVAQMPQPNQNVATSDDIDADTLLLSESEQHTTALNAITSKTPSAQLLTEQPTIGQLPTGQPLAEGEVLVASAAVHSSPGVTANAQEPTSKIEPNSPFIETDAMASKKGTRETGSFQSTQLNPTGIESLDNLTYLPNSADKTSDNDQLAPQSLETATILKPIESALSPNAGGSAAREIFSSNLAPNPQSTLGGISDSAVPVASAIAAPVLALAPTTGAHVSQSAPAATPFAATAASVAHQLAPLHQLGDGVHRLAIELHPAELGAVRVIAQVHAGDIHVELLGATDIGREALRAALPDLKRDLMAAGFGDSSFTFDSDTSGNPRQMFSNDFAGSQSNKHSPQSQNPTPHSFVNNPEIPFVPANPQSITDNGVDIQL